MFQRKLAEDFNQLLGTFFDSFSLLSVSIADQNAFGKYLESTVS